MQHIMEEEPTRVPRHTRRFAMCVDKLHSISFLKARFWPRHNFGRNLLGL